MDFWTYKSIKFHKEFKNLKKKEKKNMAWHGEDTF